MTIIIRDPKYQGIFHLLAIALIPAVLVSFFLSESWVPGIISLSAAVLIAFFLLRKR